MGLHCTKVQPAAPHQHPQGAARKTNVLSRGYQQLNKSWHRSQISHRSQYSVERLLAFQDYHRQTSVAKVVGVCILTPIPAMLAALLIDCIPLRSPSEGWRANYALWIRLFLDAFAVAMGLIAQVKEVIVTGVISNRGAVLIAFATAGSYVSLAIIVSATWCFPVPFFAIFSVVPMVLLLCLFTFMVVGPRVLASSPVLRSQVRSQLKIVATQGLVAVVFPLASTIFYRMSAGQQIAFVFITPVLKFIAKQIIASAAHSLHEYIGLIVVFSVDLFSVFYVAICMQTTKSAVTTLLMIASDGFHVLFALRSIFQQINVAKGEENGPPLEPNVHQTMHTLRDLPQMIRSVFGDSEISNRRSRRIRIFAPFPLQLSDESIAFMNEIARSQRGIHIYSSSQIFISGRRSLVSAPRFQSSGRARPKKEIGNVQYVQRLITAIDISKLSQAAPASPTSDSVPHGLLPLTHADMFLSSKTLRTAMVHDSTEEVVWDALQALFHAEYLLMAEYIECALPVLYAGYLSILYHLPISPYYPHTALQTPQKLASNVENILIFAAVEFAAFACLLLLLRRKFGILPLYQLGFVLETQARTLQGHLFVWTIFILHMPLTHYGVDFNVSLE